MTASDRTFVSFSGICHLFPPPGTPLSLRPRPWSPQPSHVASSSSLQHHACSCLRASPRRPVCRVPGATRRPRGHPHSRLRSPGARDALCPRLSYTEKHSLRVSGRRRTLLPCDVVTRGPDRRLPPRRRWTRALSMRRFYEYPRGSYEVGTFIISFQK